MPHTRRHLLKTAAVTPLAACAADPARPGAPAGPSIYARLGIKPVINGMGTVTILGGSIMPPEVIRAMDEATNYYVPIPELQRKVGERIAQILGVPAAMVSTGAAGCITIGTAVSMARGDTNKINWLPATPENKLPFEVIEQKSHQSGYEAQMKIMGAKIVTVETAAELERAAGPKTAMLFYLNSAESQGKIKRAEFLALAKKLKIPAFLDAAADCRPRSRLSQYVNEGFDLVCFSGGKGLLGPQSTGLLLGRKDLIDAGMLAQSPYGGVGRGMKVGKEELVGLLAAVERFMKIDQDAEWREFERKVAEMMATVGKVKGLTVGKYIPEIANEVPHFELKWDEAMLKKTTGDVQKRLGSGDPPIATLGGGPGHIIVSVLLMRGAEHKIVADRLVEIFKS